MAYSSFLVSHTVEMAPMEYYVLIEDTTKEQETKINSKWLKVELQSRLIDS